MIAATIAWWFLTMNATDKGPWLQQLGPFSTEAQCRVQRSWVRNGGKTDAEVKAEDDAREAEWDKKKADALKHCVKEKDGAKTCRSGDMTIVIGADGTESGWSVTTGAIFGYPPPVFVPEKLSKCFEGPLIPLEVR